MKKRVLSLLMALAMCLSMLPTTVLAEELATGTDVEQVEQPAPQEPEPVEEPGVPEGDPEELETPPAPEEESDEAVKAAQALIAALPEDVTAENAAEIERQLMALDAALEALTDEQLAQLDMTRYEALCAALAELTAEQENGHTNHALCTHGDSCTICPEGAKTNAFAGARQLTSKENTGAVGKYYTLHYGDGGEEVGKTSSNYVLPAGNYYLDGNITSSYPIYIQDNATVNLCLHGHSLTGLKHPVIRVGSGATLNLTDCGGGGKVIHGSSSDTSACLSVYGNFNLYGGILTGTTSENVTTDGHGVQVGGGVFTMYGGTITGNSYKYTTGGGVFVSGGSFAMHGGSITDNRVTGTGGSGGGVYMKDGTMSVSGDVNISGNTGGNVYLTSGKSVTLMGALGSDASIGVSTQQSPRINSPVTIAKGDNYTPTADDVEKFHKDDTDNNYEIALSGNNIVLQVPTPHEHPICGKTCDHTDKHTENLTWTGVSDLSKITAGTESNPNYYYLTKDIELDTAGWNAMDYVVLDLNGHSITANEAFDAITVGAGAHFTLTDCKGDNGSYGSITHQEKPKPNLLKDKYDGCGVNVLKDGNFTMYGGSINGNQSSKEGAGVYVAENASFTMLGGVIFDNTVYGLRGPGGGIWTVGTTTIGGSAEITGNKAQAGGGVYVAGGTLTLKDNAVVTGNISTNGYNSGIFVGLAGQLCVSGSIQVTENGNGNMVGNVYLAPDSNQRVKPIAVIGELKDAIIKVTFLNTTLNAIGDDNPMTIAQAGTAGWIKSDSFVLEGNTAHTLYVTEDGKTAVLGTHAHEWEYTASPDGYTITAKCKNENCTSNGGSVTIKAPTGDLTYDGKAKAATLEGKFNTSVANPTISYKAYENKQLVDLPDGETVPTSAGQYTASITVGEGANKATASVEYSIKQATPTVNDFVVTLPNNLTYDGNGKTVTVTVKEGIIGMGDYDVKCYYYPKNEVYNSWAYADTPTDVGTYVVRIEVQGNGNYAYTTERLIDETNWVFTITQAGYTVNVPDSWNTPTEVIEGSTLGSAIYRITDYGATTVTATGVNNESLVGRVNWYTNEARTESVDDNAKFEGEAGTTVTLYWKFVFSDEYQNYTTKDETGSVDFAIVEGPQQGLSFKDASSEKVTAGTAKYGGNPLYLNVRNGTINGGAITYASSNEKVATVQDNGNGKITVTICGVGTTEITATAARVDGQFAKTTATYTLKVEKGEWDGLVAVLMQGYDYNGNVKTPELTDYYTGESNAVTYYYSTTDTNSGGTKWENIGPTTLNAGTYYMYAEIAATANYEAYTTKASPFTVYKARPVCVPPANVTATYGQKLGDITLTNPAGNTPGTWSWVDDNQPVGNASTTVKAFMAIFTPNDTVNYEVRRNFVEVTVNKAAGSNLATVNRAQKYGDTGEYTFAPSWAGLPAGQEWNYACEYSVGTGSNATLTKKDIDDHGKLTYAISGAKAGDVVTITLKAQCNNYEDYTITLKITIEQAATTGEPGYSKITSRGKTLADVGLTVGTLQPDEGEFEWIDAEGDVLPGDTKVEANKSYTWRFTPEDENYAPLTGSITPWENITIIVPTYPTESGNVSNPSTGAAEQGSIACGVAVLAAGICLLGARRKNHE